MKLKLKSFIVCLAMGTALLAAQGRHVSGRVVDDHGQPIVGATIMVKGSNVGTITDAEGNFSINATGQADVLVVSYVGMNTAEVKAAPGMSVTLSSSSELLDEVVVTGYGNFSKTNFTGAASTVDATALEDIPVISIESKLAGNVSGVAFNTTSGNPGSTTGLRIRGMGSINAGNSPLYVIDGTPVISGNIGEFTYNGGGTSILSALNTNDIESISVIKDAAAASLYGSRAANGVIVITTKSGRAGKTQVNFRSDWGFSNMAVNYRPMLSGEERRELLYMGFKNYGLYSRGYSQEDAIAFADAQIDRYAAMPEGGYTDWKDLLFKTGQHQNYQVSATGGNDRTKLYASLSYTNQEGIVENQWLKRFTGNVNVTHRFGDFTLQATAQASKMKQSKTNEGSSYDSATANYGLYQSPSSTPYNEDGSLKDACGMRNVNPLWEQEHSSDIYTLFKALTSVKLTWNIWDNLNLSEKITYDYNDGTEDVLWDRKSNNGGPSGVMQRVVARFEQLNTQTQLTYANTFGRHNVDALLGFETEDSKYGYNYMVGQDFPGTLYELVNAGATQASSAKYRDRLASFLGRVNYSFDHRYYVGASYRTDASSRLASKNRWGSFWSASAAWRFSNESFFEPLRPYVSDGKLRFSYGVNGTLPSGYWDYMTVYAFGGSAVTYNGVSGMGYFAGNTDLRWEKNKTYNIGLDFTLIDRVSVSLDYYQRHTTDLIYDLATSYVTGSYDRGTYGNSLPFNTGALKNKGVELTIQSSNISTKDFSWNTTFTLGHNKNKLEKLYTGQTEIVDGALIHRVGEAYYSYYLYEFAGVDPETGDELFYINDGTENARNTVNNTSKANKIIAAKHEPKVEGGLTNTLRYKFIDLSFTLTYSLGGQAFDFATWSHNNGNSYLYNGPIPDRFDIDQIWSGPGDTDATLPRFQYGYSSGSTLNTRWLMPTDYLRLKSLTLGVSIPQEFISKIGISKARVYFSGSNLLTWKSHDLMVDPEMSVTGLCQFETPSLRTFTFGIDLNF